MMKLFFLLLLGILLGLFDGAIGAGEARPLTACGVHCWENTQYVSGCNGDLKCLCSDGDFQAALFKCMHSQCATSQFAASLHENLARCSGYGQEQMKAYAKHHPRSNYYSYGKAPKGSEELSPGNNEKPTRSVQRRHYVTRSAPTYAHVTRAPVEPAAVTPAPTPAIGRKTLNSLEYWVELQKSYGRGIDWAPDTTTTHPAARPTHLVARGSVYAGNSYGRPRPTGY